MADTDIVSVATVKAQLGITDAVDDAWLGGVVTAVTEAIENTTGRWFTARATTLYFDGSADASALEVPLGVSAITYLGYATTDQPDSGTGTYTEITTGIYLDPPAQDRRFGASASRIVLGGSSVGRFPTSGKRTIKATGSFGSPSTRASQIATNAIARAYRARKSGGADLAVVGPEGGMKILRDFAPAELEELHGSYGIAMVAG